MAGWKRGRVSTTDPVLARALLTDCASDLDTDIIDGLVEMVGSGAIAIGDPRVHAAGTVFIARPLTQDETDRLNGLLQRAGAV